MTARVRWIPPASRALTHPDDLGVMYAYTGRSGRPAAVAYAGKAAKAAFHYSFTSLGAMYTRAAEFFSGLEETREMKAGWKAERDKPHTIKVGDIIHHSWGWEQTQCDFYQVLAVTEHGATLQEIASETVPESTVEHGMADRRIAVRDAFHGEPFKVRISGQNYVTTLKHGSAGVWDGEPKYCSWYG